MKWSAAPAVTVTEVRFVTTASAAERDDPRCQSDRDCDGDEVCASRDDASPMMVVNPRAEPEPFPNACGENQSCRKVKPVTRSAVGTVVRGCGLRGGWTLHGDWYAAAYLPLARLSLLIGLIGCQEPSVLREVRLEKGQVAFKPLAQPVEPRMFKACYDGAVCLSEVSLSSTSIDPGREVTLQITWFVRREPGKDWRVFLHGSRNRKTAHRFSEDHDPLAGRYPTRDWKCRRFDGATPAASPPRPRRDRMSYGEDFIGEMNDFSLVREPGTRWGRALWGVLSLLKVRLSHCLKLS